MAFLDEAWPRLDISLLLRQLHLDRQILNEPIIMKDRAHASVQDFTETRSLEIVFPRKGRDKDKYSAPIYTIVPMTELWYKAPLLPFLN